MAALEAMIALRDLAEDLGPRDARRAPAGLRLPPAGRHRVRSTSATPRGTRSRRWRPSSVADIVRATLAEVDPAGHRALLDDGSALAYDALLVAIGARMEPAFSHAITFGADGAAAELSGLLADLEDGYARRVAFVLPSSTAWSLPLYELALMTARDLWSAGADEAEVAIVTPEARPLEAFGGEASAMVAELLAQQRIEFIGSVTPEVRRDAVLAGERRLEVDRTVALPALVGPQMAGLPEAPPTASCQSTSTARVRGITDVYAVGDGTDYRSSRAGWPHSRPTSPQPSDRGGACGAAVEPEPFRPRPAWAVTDRWPRAAGSCAPAGGREPRPHRRRSRWRRCGGRRRRSSPAIWRRPG